MPQQKLRRRGLLYEEYRVGSWEEFLELITDTPFANWAFRGQSNGSGPLFTSLARYFLNYRIHPSAWPDQEERVLRIFKRKAHQYLAQPPAAGDDFQWLALMQHHGAPTRLLDFTWSPYVAAFFALTKSLGDGCVWALNPERVSRERTRVSSGRVTITPAKVDPNKPGNFRKHFLRGQAPFLWVGEPGMMNRRLIAQSGTFAVPGLLHKPIEDILSGYPEPQNILAKFILPSDKVREKGLRELYRMNITWATLFPDLDGLARSLGYELEFHWAYNPRTMRQYRTRQS